MKLFKKILDCLFAIELLIYSVEKILFLNSNSALFLWELSTECLRSLSPRIKFTLTENLRPIDSVQYVKGKGKGKGKGNNSIWNETFGITRELLFVSTLIHPQRRWTQTKPLRKSIHFTESHIWIWLYATQEEDPLVLVGHISFTFVFSQMILRPFVGDRNSHWKHRWKHEKREWS
jgi:hypothetical protein